MGLDSGGGTALSSLTPYQQNTHYSLIGGGISNDISGGGGSNLATSTGYVLGDGIIDFLGDAIAEGNPYAVAFAYDPTSDMGDIQDSLDLFQDLITNLDPETDYSSHLAQALTEVDTLISSTHIDDEVDAFETKTANQFARSVNRFTAGMADINAVNSSAFILGLAQMENLRQAELDAYRAQLNTQKQNQRAVLAAQFAQEMGAMLARKVAAQESATRLQSDTSRANIIAQREFLAEELELDFKDLTYEMELFGYANATLAAGLGATQRPLGPSKTSTALSAAIGAGGTLASLGGQISPALGATLGIAGALTTYFANAG